MTDGWPTDAELLDFDSSNYDTYDEAKAREALASHGDVFRAQLVAAAWIAGWRERLIEHESRGTEKGKEFAEGIDYALRNIVAHLRQGDLIPGGILYHDQVGWPEEEKG